MTAMTEQRTVTVGYAKFVVPFDAPVHEFAGVQVVVAPNGKVFEACDRCGGFTGCIPTFGYVFAGQCFGCRGSGVGKAHESLAAAEKNLAKRAKAKAAAERRRQAKWEARAVEIKAEFDAWVAVNPELTKTLAELADRWAPINANGDYDTYGDDMDERVDGWLFDAAKAVRNGNIPGRADTIPGLLAEYLAKREAKELSVYAGDVDDVVTVTGEVSVAMVIDGQWGSSMMLVWGNGPVTAKTYTTAKWAWEVERGTTLTVTGTVKKLDEYEGTKQTVLARPKVAKPTKGGGALMP